MAARLVTAIEIAATAAIRWHAQYETWPDDRTFHDGTTKGEIEAKLNSQRHTPENIAAIINAGWAYPTCGGCGQHQNVVVEIKDNWREDGIMLCPDCLGSASGMVGEYLASRPSNGEAR